MGSPDRRHRYGQIVDIVRYPSGEIALYVVSFGPRIEGDQDQRPW